MAYRSAKRISRITIGLFAADATVTLFAIVSSARLRYVFTEALAGRPPSAATARADDMRQNFLILLQTLLYPLMVATFCVWIYRAYSNLQDLNAGDRRTTPGWAVAHYFIPVLCLFRPFQDMRETWNASKPVLDDPDDRWSRSARMEQTPPTVAIWFTLYLLLNFAANLSLWTSMSMIRKGRSIPGMIEVVDVHLAFLVLRGLAAVLAILVISRITHMQDERFAMLAALPPAPGEGGGGADSPEPAGVV